MRKLIIAIGLALAFTSCDNFFEPKLSNERTLEQIINEKPMDIIGWVAKSFRSFQGSPDSWDGYNFLDCATDNAVTNKLTANINLMQSQDGYWRSTSNPIGDWKARFDDIRHINMFLEIGRDPKIRYFKSDSVKNDILVTRTTAEAFFMRAYEQFLLLRHNAGYSADGELLGFPIVTKVMSVDNFEKLPRDPYDSCVAQIIADIDSALSFDIAKGGLPEDWRSNTTAYPDVNGADCFGRPTLLTCLALKSRVLLYAASPAFTPGGTVSVERYTKAAEAAAELIDIIGKKLPDVYKGGDTISSVYYNNPENEELLLRRLMGQNGAGSLDMAKRNYPPVALFGGGGQCNPTQNLVDAFPMSDGYPRGEGSKFYDDQYMYDDRDPRLAMVVLRNGSEFRSGAVPKGSTVTLYTYSTSADSTIANCMPGAPGVTESNSTRTGYFLRKWMDTETSLVDGATKPSNYYNVIFRKGEIFLNYAEAAYYAYGWDVDGPSGLSAKDALKEVRRRAGHATDGYIDAVAGDDIIKLIKNERRIELCFEGHRFWDLRRWKDSLTTPIEGVIIHSDFGVMTTTREVLFTPVYDESYMYYLPIPNSEILKAPYIKQNKGW